jgi:hypothetical protein
MKVFGGSFTRPELRSGIGTGGMPLCLAELGLSPPEDEKPPPVREVVFLPVDDEGREIQVG